MSNKYRIWSVYGTAAAEIEASSSTNNLMSGYGVSKLHYGDGLFVYGASFSTRYLFKSSDGGATLINLTPVASSYAASISGVAQFWDGYHTVTVITPNISQGADPSSEAMIQNSPETQSGWGLTYGIASPFRASDAISLSTELPILVGNASSLGNRVVRSTSTVVPPIAFTNSGTGIPTGARVVDLDIAG